MLSGESCKGNGYSNDNIEGGVNWISVALNITFCCQMYIVISEQFSVKFIGFLYHVYI